MGLAAALLTAAAALAQPVPTVTIGGVPPEVLIGETFTFTVEFRNDGDAPGFGPYLVLCLPAPGADGDSQGGPCDGFSFDSAAAVFTGQTVSLPPANPGLIQSPQGSPIVCQGLAEGAANPLCRPPNPLPPGFEGCQIVVLQLPFGSFYPDQPAVSVQITVRAHAFADAGTPLPVRVVGGFHFGEDAAGGACLEGAASAATTVPIPYTVRKTYLGPEGETTTGPNFPRQYRIDVDVADEQTLAPLKVTENLPGTLVYLGPYGPPVVSAPAPGTPNGTVELDFGAVTGGPGNSDASFTFQFYAPDRDTAGNPVLDPATCKGTAVDDIRGEAVWDPLDTRDPDGPVVSDVTPEDHVLELECLAVQKSVAPPGDHIPGDQLTYTLDLQVSDYVQTGDVVVTDVLSDGLLFLAQPSPTLAVTDKNGTVQGTFTLGTDAVVDASAKSPCGDGSTVVRFDVSKALAALTAGVLGAHPLHQAGVVTGGEVAPAPPSAAAVATITYHVEIADQFDCPVPSQDQSVDKHDRLVNRTAVRGEVLELAGEKGAVTAQDDSRAKVDIAHGLVEKSIAARNGDPNDPRLEETPPRFAPGDIVTFRLSYVLPSTDAEDFRLEDFLPSPVLDAAEVTTVIQGPCPAVPPPAGTACLGPNDQLGAFLGTGSWPQVCPGRPGFADPGRNSVCFHFGSFDDPDNLPRHVEILVTVTLTAVPFADGLLLTNEVLESEQSSFEERFDQTRIEQVVLGQPVVRVSKGAVSACCPHPTLRLCAPVGRFSPSTVGPVPFGQPEVPALPCNQRFTPPVTSSGLAGAPVGSGIEGGVNPGDRIVFAAVVENTGSSPHGAFDVRVRDTLPPGLALPGGGIDLCVTDGAGNPLPFNDLGGGLFGSGIELVDPGPTQGVLAPGSGNASGSNLAVVTYVLEVTDDLGIGACAANRAALTSYAGTEGGVSHLEAGLGGPHQDTTQVCRRPELVKSLVATSEAHTGATGGVEAVAIGEVVRFRLVLEVHEGTMPGLRIDDDLPAGLSYLPGTVRIAFVSSQGGLASSSVSGPGLAVAGNEATVAGITPTFVPPPGVEQTLNRVDLALGDLVNADDDCDREFVVVEFNALVGNVATNQSDRLLDNVARAFWGSQLVTSNPVRVRVVEPRLALRKEMAEGRAVGLFVANVGTADAFDVVVADELPPSLCLQPGTAVRVEPSTGATVTVAGKRVQVEIERIPVGQTIVIAFEVVLCGEDLSCEATVNLADVTYTSLPGPNGTVANPTGSATPGASGAPDGERNGDGGPVNTYHDRAAHSEFADCPPDLSVSKVCNLGDILVCSIVVTNLGPGVAGSFTLEDVLPPGTQLHPFLPPGGPGWTCTAGGSQGPLACTYDDPQTLPLSPGEQTSTLVVRISRGPSGEWPLLGHNCARVEVEGDANPANDVDCFGACPDASEASYLVFYEYPLTGGDPCARFTQEACPGGTAFKSDCGCGCREQPRPDLAVAKTCPANGPGVCTVTVQNVGAGTAVGTLTVTDTLPPGVSLADPGVFGNGWRCDVGGEPRTITCTWEGPPLAPGEQAPPLSIPVSPAPGGPPGLPKNCARVALLGDANEQNDLGCSLPPGCPDPKDPRVHYVSEDPAACSVIRFRCGRFSQTLFTNECGCGCIDRFVISDDPPIEIDFEIGFGLVLDPEPCDEATGASCLGRGPEADFDGPGRPGFGLSVGVPLGRRLRADAFLFSGRLEGQAAFSPREPLRRVEEEIDGDLRATGLGLDWLLTPGRRVEVRAGLFGSFVSFPGSANVEVEDAFGPGASLAVSVPLGDGRWALTGKLRYVRTATEVRARDTGETSDVTFEPLIVSTGVSYRF